MVAVMRESIHPNTATSAAGTPFIPALARPVDGSGYRGARRKMGQSISVRQASVAGSSTGSALRSEVDDPVNRITPKSNHPGPAGIAVAGPGLAPITHHAQSSAPVMACACNRLRRRLWLEEAVVAAADRDDLRDLPSPIGLLINWRTARTASGRSAVPDPGRLR